MQNCTLCLTVNSLKIHLLFGGLRGLVCNKPNIESGNSLTSFSLNHFPKINNKADIISHKSCNSF